MDGSIIFNKLWAFNECPFSFAPMSAAHNF